MTLPGVRTVLEDRFQTLSRTDIPDGTRVVAIGRRTNDPEDSEAEGAVKDFRVFNAASERRVIQAFGQDSELHRAYVELASGGAARISLVSWGRLDENGEADSGSADEDIDAELIDEAFEVAEGIQPDIIVPYARGGHPGVPQLTDEANYPEIGFSADLDDVVSLVGDKCKQITDRSSPVFAVLGVFNREDPNYEAKIWDGEEVVDDDPQVSVGDLIEFLENPVKFPDRSLLENGHYVSIVATQVKTIRLPDEWGWSNGAALYAGLLASLDSEVSPTGRLLFNVQGRPRFVPTRPQQQSLIDLGVVPIAQNFRRQSFVVDGLTFSKAESDYTRLSTLRIVFDAIQLVREACQYFIGMPATLHHRNSLETAVGSRLRSMVVAGALVDADFTVTYVPAMNEARIDLVLTPAFELRRIEVSISIQL